MNIEKQVVGLDIAQRLKALGVNGWCHFVWCVTDMRHWLITYDDRYQNTHTNQFAAYTVPELIELLGDEFVLICQKSKGKFQAYSSPERLKIASADTPANALGLLLEEVLNERRGEH